MQMADDQELAAEDAEEAPEAGAGRRKRGREAAGYEALADRYLRRAHKALSEGEPTEQADFFLRAANVYATLELARALRSSPLSSD
jgi:hypothetical protein